MTQPDGKSECTCSSAKVKCPTSVGMPSFFGTQGWYTTSAKGPRTFSAPIGCDSVRSPSPAIITTSNFSSITEVTLERRAQKMTAPSTDAQLQLGARGIPLLPRGASTSVLHLSLLLRPHTLRPSPWSYSAPQTMPRARSSRHKPAT
ncbi:hypothetical protein PG989_003012 [Apiospora arundinis]